MFIIYAIKKKQLLIKLIKIKKIVFITNLIIVN
jgi:hypothetical protein